MAASIAVAWKAPSVSTEPPQIPSPSIAERTIDTATDVSHTIEEVTASLKTAVDRLREAIANAEQPGQPIPGFARSPAKRRCRAFSWRSCSGSCWHAANRGTCQVTRHRGD